MRANPAHPSSSLFLCHLSLGLIFSNPAAIYRTRCRAIFHLFVYVHACVCGWVDPVGIAEWTGVCVYSGEKAEEESKRSRLKEKNLISPGRECD